MANEAAAKRSRAWVEVEHEAVAALRRKYGLESSAERVLSGSRRARI